MKILFATSNQHKFEEAAAYLAGRGIQLERFPIEHREMRSESLEEIARDAARFAFKKCKKPVFVEDAGLFISALNGFPGTYSAWVQKKLGNAGILKLMAGAPDRSAYFEACIAYHDGKRISCFSGRCPGSISEGARGASGFGYDPIFVPEGYPQTFAENILLKNNISHRYKSLLEFSKSLEP
ncbi:XTP/dITP diphosphatase [Candidatus Micrarchaeota archaeon]|nr:XTP/dITP diphosphatase [Candidatus Micrarchaeota archaeon]